MNQTKPNKPKNKLFKSGSFSIVVGILLAAIVIFGIVGVWYGASEFIKNVYDSKSICAMAFGIFAILTGIIGFVLNHFGKLIPEQKPKEPEKSNK